MESRLADIPVGMTLELFSRLSALLSGYFLRSRGAVLPALADRGLPMSAMPWAGAALAYGRWSIQMLCSCGTAGSSRKASGTRIVIKASGPSRVIWSACFVHRSTGMSPSLIKPQPTKSCLSSYWR